MNILGFSSLEPSPFGHDSTTAIFDEDDFFVISEERLTRIKHDGGYPSSSIQLCLKKNNLTMSDIDRVVVGSRNPPSFPSGATMAGDQWQ